MFANATFMLHCSVEVSLEMFLNFEQLCGFEIYGATEWAVKITAAFMTYLCQWLVCVLLATQMSPNIERPSNIFRFLRVFPGYLRYSIVDLDDLRSPSSPITNELFLFLRFRA